VSFPLKLELCMFCTAWPSPSSHGLSHVPPSFLPRGTQQPPHHLPCHHSFSETFIKTFLESGGMPCAGTVPVSLVM